MRRKNVDIIFVVMNVDVIRHLQTANSKQKPGLIGDIYFKVSVTYAIIKNTSTRLTTATLHPLHPIQTNLILLYGGRVMLLQTRRAVQNRPTRQMWESKEDTLFQMEF